jgi:hypothetical protein
MCALAAGAHGGAGADDLSCEEPPAEDPAECARASCSAISLQVNLGAELTVGPCCRKHATPDGGPLPRQLVTGPLPPDMRSCCHELLT